MPGAEFYVAVDNVCAWPNLALLPNGEVAAALYNKPSHGFGCGDIELWVSEDGGRMWRYRSTISDHSDHPEHVRMNHAVGLNMRGEIVVLASGYSAGRDLPHLDVQVCVSQDQGNRWERSSWDAPCETGNVPFGDIVCQPDGALVAALYGTVYADNGTGERAVYSHRSTDHGHTWGEPKLIAATRGETALVRLRSGKWLAAARMDYSPYALVLFASPNDALDWQEIGPITLPAQQPGHLLELRDGRILLTYGSRAINLYGVGARISEDEGASWSIARPLVNVPGPTDCGYPSSVELEDGTIVTAYYAGAREMGYTDPGDEGYGDPEKGLGARAKMPYGFPWHQRYHMGVCRWRPEMLSYYCDHGIPRVEPRRNGLTPSR